MGYVIFHSQQAATGRVWASLWWLYELLYYIIIIIIIIIVKHSLLFNSVTLRLLFLLHNILQAPFQVFLNIH